MNSRTSPTRGKLAHASPSWYSYNTVLQAGYATAPAMIEAHQKQMDPHKRTRCHECVIVRSVSAKLEVESRLLFIFVCLLFVGRFTYTRDAPREPRR